MASSLRGCLFQKHLLHSSSRAEERSHKGISSLIPYPFPKKVLLATQNLCGSDRSQLVAMKTYRCLEIKQADAAHQSPGFPIPLHASLPFALLTLTGDNGSFEQWRNVNALNDSKPAEDSGSAELPFLALHRSWTLYPRLSQVILHMISCQPLLGFGILHKELTLQILLFLISNSY